MLDRNGLEILDRAESLRLLSTAPVGRVGVMTDAMPVVLPVNFVLDDELVVICTTPGTKLYVAMTDAMVAFEADEYDPTSQSGWSVMVSGRARVLTKGEEIARARALPLRRWGPQHEESFVSLEAQVVTGRRIA